MAFQMPRDLTSLFRANPPSQPNPMTPTMGSAIGRMFGGAPQASGLAGIGNQLGRLAGPAATQVPVAPAVSQMAPGLAGITNAVSQMPAQAKAYGVRRKLGGMA